tara:strand:- start:124 stop:357 length:234 start_codon:yes stop_codon:yes gene_type:complete
MAACAFPVTAKSPDEDMELPNRAVLDADNVPVILTEETEPVPTRVNAPETLRVLPKVAAPTLMNAPDPDVDPATVRV